MIEFNPDPRSIGEGIVFIHVGKCAGETILNALDNDNLLIYEYHCFDASRKIADAVRLMHPSVQWLVAIRDPIDRWVSAFNWAKHQWISDGRKEGELGEIFTTFDTASSLAKDLASSYVHTNLRARAAAASPFTHMSMGLSWYLPTYLYPWMPQDRVHFIDVKTIERDLRRFAEATGLTLSRVEKCKAMDGADKNIYPTSLTPKALLVLTEHLSTEIKAYNFWTHFAGRYTNH